MVTQRRWLSTLLPLLSVANATLTQELRDRKLPDCSSDIIYSDIEDKGTFWYNTGAEQFANDYINSNTDHTMWAQNLFRELLGNRDYSNFDCRTTGATCDTPGDMCGTQIWSLSLNSTVQLADSYMTRPTQRSQQRRSLLPLRFPEKFPHQHGIFRERREQQFSQKRCERKSDPGDFEHPRRHIGRVPGPAFDLWLRSWHRRRCSWTCKRSLWRNCWCRFWGLQHIEHVGLRKVGSE